MGFEDLLQTRIKRVGRGLRDLVGGDEKLLLGTAASPKGHERLLPPSIGIAPRKIPGMITLRRQDLKTLLATLSTPDR